MKGKVYEFIDPKTGEIEYVREDNLGGFEGDFAEDVKKRFGKHTKKVETERNIAEDGSVIKSTIPPEILKKLEEEEELGL